MEKNYDWNWINDEWKYLLITIKLIDTLGALLVIEFIDFVKDGRLMLLYIKLTY